MSEIVKSNVNLSAQIPRATQVLIDYEYWLTRNYGKTGTYLVNAKSFLRTYKQGGDVISQLSDYVSKRSASLNSILKRFQIFLEAKGIYYLINDINETKLPISNGYIKVFLSSIQDRLRSKRSVGIYATVLNGYFESIKQDVGKVNKKTASKYILSPTHSDYTKRLYKSILKNFAEWALLHQSIHNSDLSKDERLIKKGLKKISTQSLREIISIKVTIPRTLTSTYHKDSLTEKQRINPLKIAKNSRDRAIISLMAWNGLRSIEVLRLNYSDVKLTQGKILIWGKGRSEKSKDSIKLSQIVKREIKNYLKVSKLKKGKLFGGITRLELDGIIKNYFKKLRLKGKYTPHSLRHTAGQMMYEKGIPLELIQKTLRHADMRTTMIYSQKAIDKSYFKKMKRF
jgi:integrase/recombinase XerD